VNGLVISKNFMVEENGGDFERHDDFRKTEWFRMNFKYGGGALGGQSLFIACFFRKFRYVMFGFLFILFFFLLSEI
jgi:hypothetical protein